MDPFEKMRSAPLIHNHDPRDIRESNGADMITFEFQNFKQIEDTAPVDIYNIIEIYRYTVYLRKERRQGGHIILYSFIKYSDDGWMLMNILYAYSYSLVMKYAV